MAEAKGEIIAFLKVCNSAQYLLCIVARTTFSDSIFPIERLDSLEKQETRPDLRSTYPAKLQEFQEKKVGHDLYQNLQPRVSDRVYDG